MDVREKKERSKKLQAISREKKQKFYHRFVGTSLRILTEEQDETGHWLGFSDNYIKVAVKKNGLSPNQLLEITVTSVADGLALATLD